MSPDARSPAPTVVGWQATGAAGLEVARTTARPIGGTVVDRAFFWLFIAGLAWCPFWFGSNVLLAWGVNAVLFPGLCLLYEVSRLVQGERGPKGIEALKLSAGLFLTVLAWIFVQNATWTPSILHHPIWMMAAKALDTPVSGSISVDRDLTTLALIRLITAASVFWLAFHLCRDRSRANVLLRAIAAIGCGYAAYGLVSFALTPGWVLWVKDAGLPGMGVGIVRSTFINRNSYATYAGIGLITICGLLLQLYRREAIDIGGSWRFRVANFIELTGRKGTVLVGGAFVILVALLLTGSRGGVLATGVGLFVLGALTFGKRKQGAMDKLGIIGFGAIVIAGAFLVFGDAVLSHISHEGLYDESRTAVYLIVLRSILSAPLLGYGYGTFADIFPMYRDRSIAVDGVWTQAHNTYLEIFQGLGLVFGAMLIASLVRLAGRCLKGSIQNRGSVTAPRIAASVAVLVGMHALVDFSLQIQAVAITFMAVLGAGVAQSETVERVELRR
jgi:O-antigen ligase